MTQRIRRQGRPRADEELLSRERILAAALQIVNEEGMGKLTMRRLATALNVDPMAIYRYLPGKAAVIGGLVEMVFGHFSVATSEDAPWQDQVRAFVEAYRSLTRTYANLALYLVTDTEAGSKAALPANEILYRALLKAGLPPRWVLHAADLIVDYLNGCALAESSGALEESDNREGFVAALVGEAPDHYPTMRSLLQSLPTDDTHVGDDPEIEIILSGIEAMAKRYNS